MFNKKTTHKGVVEPSLSTTYRYGQLSVRFDEILAHSDCNCKQGGFKS